MTGRRTKLTPELQDKICKLIRDGNYLDTACRVVGIGASTFCLWRSKGEKASSGLYMEFIEATKKAEAEAKKRWVQIIDDASKTNWQASAWFLERKYPEEWARRQPQEHKISGDIIIRSYVPRPDYKQIEATKELEEGKDAEGQS